MADTGRPVYASIEVDGWKGTALVEAKTQNPATQIDRWKSWLAILTSHPETLPGHRVLKTSKTVEVMEAMCPFQPPRHVVCKQVKIRSTKNAVLSRFRPSSARRNFQRAVALRNAGIATATPLAWLERRSPPSSWLITEFLDGIIDLDTYVLSALPRLTNTQGRSQRNAVIEALVRAFRGLDSARLYHRDMKASNILIADRNDHAAALPRIFLVDLDGLAAKRLWRSSWKPIVRLAASLLQYPAVTRTDCARFLRRYLAAGGKNTDAWRDQFRRMRKQAARYSQAARKRKSEKLDGFTG